MKLFGAVFVVLGVAHALPFPRPPVTGPGAGGKGNFVPFGLDLARDDPLITNEVDTEGDETLLMKPLSPEPARFLTPPVQGQEATYFQPDSTSDLRQPAIILSPPMVREPMDSYMPQDPGSADTVPEEPPREHEYVHLYEWRSPPANPNPASDEHSEPHDSYEPMTSDSSSEDRLPDLQPPKADDSYLPMADSDQDGVTEVPPADGKEDPKDQDSYLPVYGDSQPDDTVTEIPPPEQSDSKNDEPEVPEYSKEEAKKEPSEADDSYGVKQARAYIGEETVAESLPADEPSPWAYPAGYPPPADGPDKWAKLQKGSKHDDTESEPRSPKATGVDRVDDSSEGEKYSEDRAYLPEPAKTGVAVDTVPSADSPSSYDSKEEKDSYLPEASETSGYGDDYAAIGIPPKEDAPMTSAHDSNTKDSSSAAEDASSADLVHEHSHDHNHTEEDDAASVTVQPEGEDSGSAEKSDSANGERTKRGVCSSCGGGGGGNGAFVGVGIAVPIPVQRQERN